MKKAILIATIFGTITSASYGQAKKRDWSEVTLKGHIKSITENHYFTIEKFGEIKKGELRSSLSCIFDDKGNIVEKNIYGSDGSLTQKTIYKYDENNNKIEVSDYAGDGSLTQKQIYKYAGNRNMMEYNMYQEGKLKQKFTYKRDSNGNSLEETEYGEDGKLGWKSVNKYKYDRNGNMIEKNYYSIDGKYTGKQTYKYDSDNNKIGCNSYEADGRLSDWKESYKYDGNGNMIEWETPKGILIRKYQYDNNMNVIKEIYIADINPSTNSITESEILYFKDGDRTKQQVDSVNSHIGSSKIVFDYQNKIDYSLPSEGTVTFWIYIKEGCGYNNFVIYRGEEVGANIYTTTGNDAWWPGSTWFNANNSGDIELSMATTKGAGPQEKLKASGTAFKYNEWHKLGFSYGSEGQYIYLDGQIVASNPANTHVLDYMNDCSKSVFGYFKSCVFQNKEFDLGFSGLIDSIKVSEKQKDWK